MRVKDNTELVGKELFDYLIANEKEIVAEKKSTPIYSEVLAVKTEDEFFSPIVTKAANEAELEPDTLIVKVVANMAMVMDSHLDVCGVDSPKKSIKENKGIIPHIHDHEHSVTAKIGKVLDIRLEYINLKKIGVKSEIAEGQAVVFETLVRKDFNPTVYNLYKHKEVNQHSIGLQYVKIDLAVNSEEDEYKTQFKLWKKHIDNVINKIEAEARGYFWYVSEYKLFENSSVLFGSNKVTPTLSTQKSEPSSDTQKQEPSSDTQKQEPSKDTLIDNDNKQDNNKNYLLHLLQTK